MGLGTIIFALLVIIGLFLLYQVFIAGEGEDTGSQPGETNPRRSAKPQVPKSRKSTRKTTKKVSSAGENDDLTRIEGIGPKIAKILIEGGIRRFQQLAKQDQATLEALVTNGGIGLRKTVAQTWPEQARLAQKGDWLNLKKLQNQLKGGVR